MVTGNVNQLDLTIKLITITNLLNLTYMYVIKRNGKKETVKFDKITARIEKLCYSLEARLVNVN